MTPKYLGVARGWGVEKLLKAAVTFCALKLPVLSAAFDRPVAAITSSVKPYESELTDLAQSWWSSSSCVWFLFAF